jgi:hypothetical protein
VGDFLPGDRPGWDARRWWQVTLTLIVTAALTAGGVHWLSGGDRPGANERPAAAQGFADAALAAFSTSTTIAAAGSALTPAHRSAGLPTDPVAGLTSHTPAGPVQVVLPGGLGAAQPTTGGQVVYPDAGAGFDMLAENTATGTRTVARINGPNGVRMVTTFVRTPADTVMLAHTNGFLTINRATPTAETAGVFSPAETRDATGRLVPSSYVVKQVGPQLYALAEVIDPRPDTVWPVYVDPPLHVGGPGGAPLPAGLFDSITSTISSAASAVGDAVSTAASATVSGVQTVGRVVKAHPLESAMLVGGVAMALTGVGGPAGAAMIASAGVNIASAGVDFAAALNPDNQALGVVSNVLGVASMVTPQGAAKAAVKEVAEKATEELATHADDVANAAKKVIDTATETPTPPAQLANDIASAPVAAKPPLPGVDTPKAPNAPPAKTSDLPVATSPETGGPCGCNAITPEPKGGVYVIYNAKGEPKYVGQSIHIDQRLNEHIRESLKPSTKPGAARYDPAAGDRAYVLHRTDDPDALNGLEQHEIRQHNTYTSKANPNPNYNGGLNRKLVYRNTNRKAGVYDAARDAHLQRYQRPSSPADQRQIQQASIRQSTNEQRRDAQSSAREANQTSSRSSSSESKNSSSHKSSDNKKKKKPKKKKSSQNHPKPKG